MRRVHRFPAWPRRAAGLLVVGGLLVAAVVAYQGPPEFSRATPAVSSTTAASTPHASTPSGPGGRPSPSSAQPTTGTTDVPDGPGTTEPGILIMAAPNADGSFEVVEMVRTSKPGYAIALRPPPLTDAGDAFSTLRPRASQVQVSAGDQPLRVAEAVVTKEVYVGTPLASDAFTLRYRLDGTVVRSVPSTAGRASAALGPLTGNVPDDLPVVVMLMGDSVRNLQCPALDFADQACATGALPRLRVDRPLPWKNCVVVVQLDLPMPR